MTYGKESDAMRECRESYIRDRAAERQVVLLNQNERAEKVGDLVRDAFYEACESAQERTAPRTRMSQAELFAAWVESKARKQLLAAFPSLANSVRSA